MKLLDGTYSFWIIDSKVNGNSRAEAWSNQYHWPSDVGLPKLLQKNTTHPQHSETMQRKEEMLKEIDHR